LNTKDREKEGNQFMEESPALLEEKKGKAGTRQDYYYILSSKSWIMKRKTKTAFGNRE
jgi:hypothetical protein